MELKFGNPDTRILNLSQKDSIFQKYFDEYSKFPYNNYLNSVIEIEKIIDIQNQAKQSKDWNKIKAYCDLMDRNKNKEAYKQILIDCNIESNQKLINYLANCSDELGTLIARLKIYYNRPRPYQVAYYSKQDLFPLYTINAFSPAYPSGHASQFYFVCSILSSLFPLKAKEIMETSNRISNSRIILGVHYPSDNKFGIELTKSLLQKDEIKNKYIADNLLK